jgi:predicted nucleic acid-binding protein
MDPIDVAGIPEGALLLIDTAPIVYILENHPKFAPRFSPVFEAHDAGKLRLAVTTVTIAEVLTGPMKREDRVLVRQYRDILQAWQVVPLTTELAEEAALVRATYGLKLPDAVQVAAARATHAYALVTNDRGFRRAFGASPLSDTRLIR